MSRAWQLWPPQPIFVTFSVHEFLIWCALIDSALPGTVCLSACNSPPHPFLTYHPPPFSCMCLSPSLPVSLSRRLSNITGNMESRQTKMNGSEEEEQPVILPSPWPHPWHNEPQMPDMTEDQVLQSKPGRDKIQQAPWMMNEFCSRKKPSCSYHDTWALVHRSNTCHIM